jgi:hypothetical protein
VAASTMWNVPELSHADGAARQQCAMAHASAACIGARAQRTLKRARYGRSNELRAAMYSCVRLLSESSFMHSCPMMH